MKEQAHWDDFMRRQPRNPSMLGSVPVAFRSAALCEWLMRQCGDNASFIRLVPEQAFTRALAHGALARCAGLLEHIPARLIDKELCLTARIGDHGFDLARVPPPWPCSTRARPWPSARAKTTMCCAPSPRTARCCWGAGPALRRRR
ncbi:hypothetical protein HF313_14505 [Massilia atriviolacea]|uniref:Uncharacterized protein n=1 Tax=Massilia atriviolacea TaxID=2495579 RepID=A0A430HQY8_9BURK|nr:hypothetical protein [Massilia atriviolacea]RSZ59932.1 hypothetical protein EJB06_07040 [Massilia atriviolacea]